MATNEKKVRVEVLGRIRSGQQPFLAWGYSCLKVTRDTLDGSNNIVPEEVELRVPIKSIGLAEVMESINRKTPQAPTTRRSIRADSDEGKALGLKANKIVETEDFTDPGYKELMADYRIRSMYRMILSGLATDIVEVLDDGREVVVVESNGQQAASKVIDEEKAITILKQQGISNEHAEQLYSDVKALTTKEQARIDQE